MWMEIPGTCIRQGAGSASYFRLENLLRDLPGSDNIQDFIDNSAILGPFPIPEPRSLRLRNPEPAIPLPRSRGGPFWTAPVDNSSILSLKPRIRAPGQASPEDPDGTAGQGAA